jgi:hypothetical protein
MLIAYASRRSSVSNLAFAIVMYKTPEDNEAGTLT